MTQYRRGIFLFAIFCFFLLSAFAESEINLSNLSVDELLKLRDEVNLALQDKGYVVYRELSRGDKGEEVIELQNRLTELGYFSGTVNGKFDSETSRAVKQFQRLNGVADSGVATVETLLILYGTDAEGMPVATPKPTSTPKPTINPELESYNEFDYTEAARYPEKYNGTPVSGKVIQVIGSKERGFTLRVSIGSDVVYVTTERNFEFNILENDRVTVYAILNGTKTYTSVLGQSITIPYAKAQIIQLRQ